MRGLTVPRGAPRATTNAAFGFLSWALPFALTLVVTPWVIFSLGPGRYGIYALIMGSMAASVGLLAPSRALVRALATSTSRLDSGPLISVATVATLFGGCLLAGLVGALAEPLARTVFRVESGLMEVSVLSFQFAALVFPLALVGHLLAAVPQGLERFDLHGSMVTALALTLLAGNGVLALLDADLVTFVAWSATVSTIGCVAFLTLARRLVPSFRFESPLSWYRLSPHSRFAGLVFASQAPGHLLLLIERSWIVRTLGASALSYYVVPMMLGLTLHAAMASLASVLFPLASGALARQDEARLQLVYRRAIKLASTLLVLVVTTLLVSGDRGLLLWLGSEFAVRSGPVLSIHAIAFGTLALAVIPWSIADAAGRPRWNVALAAAWLVIDSTLLLLLVPRYGIQGAAIARLASMAMVPLHAAYVEQWLFGHVLWSFWCRLLSHLCLAGLATAALQWILLQGLPVDLWGLGGAVVLSSILFFAMVRLSGFFSTTERRWIVARVRSLFGR